MVTLMTCHLITAVESALAVVRDVGHVDCETWFGIT